jgi:hypothetical protein
MKKLNLSVNEQYNLNKETDALFEKILINCNCEKSISKIQAAYNLTKEVIDKNNHILCIEKD